MSSDKVDTRAAVGAYIARHGLLSAGGKYLVALSGGADSVALLLLLLDLGYRVEAAHCNFHLRGAESDRDEAFVAGLCRERGVALHLAHFDTAGYASLHKVSIEMAARTLRYAYFERLRADIGADAVCVAHHRGDNVETVLMNLIRGTGIRGLAGIRPVNGTVVRPLLCLSRGDIEAYLRSVGQGYVTDSTNLVADVTRNKIRLEVLPLLEKINPAVVENIRRTAEHIAEAEKVFDRAVAEAVARVSKESGGVVEVDVARLSGEPSPESVLFEILSRHGFTPQQVGQVCGCLDAPTGRMYSSPTHDLLFDRGRLLIAERRESPKPLVIPEPGLYAMADGRRLRVACEPLGEGFAIPRTGLEAAVDASKVAFPLVLRPVGQGDRFVPFGMKGSKLVSDYLTDRKANVFEKRSQLMLTDAAGQAVWLVGERVDNRCRITGSTAEAIVVGVE